MENTVLEKFHQGRQSLGTFSAIGSPLAVESLRYTGLDYVIVDTEHSPAGIESAAAQIAAAQGAGLTALARAGREAWVLVVVQMAGPRCFRPNDAMDPAFGKALREAAAAGVRIHCVDCLVTEDSLCCRAPVPVYL